MQPRCVRRHLQSSLRRSTDLQEPGAFAFYYPNLEVLNGYTWRRWSGRRPGGLYARDNFFDRPLEERRADFEKRLAQALAARKAMEK
jgi:hypothetical protein